MNQKLRTARSGMVILFAVLCIVCLSLSLVLSAHFAAYAEEENATLHNNDGKGHDLWLVHYEGQEAGESLWNGIHDGKPISYIDSVRNDDGSYIVREGNKDEISCFVPYRGINLTIALNPDYETADGTLGSLYDLEHAEYIDNSGIGDANSSTDKYTKVTAQPLTDSAASEALVLEKEWKIATLCNTVDFEGTYISDRGYAVAANYNLLHPVLGDTVVYEISSAGFEKIVAVKYEQDRIVYLQAGKGVDGYFVTEEAWDQAEQTAAVNANDNLINYIICRLDALVATSDMDAYTLTVTAMDIPAQNGEISYTQSSKSYKFSVTPQGLGDDAENDATFETNFKYSFENRSVEYTNDSGWLNKLGFTLSLNNGNIVLEEGKDYIIYAESVGVGLVDLRIVGSGNLSGYHTLKSEVRITPAENVWSTTPNIVTWVYGTYNPNNNLIVGLPKLLDNPNDVKFRIVKITKNGEEEIEGLSDIHYYVYEDADGNLKTDYIVTEDVIAILKDLGAGAYRLYASVYGSYATAHNPDRNYQPIEEMKVVDFNVFMGTNSWKAGAEPTIKDGGWIAGKLGSTDGLINAESVFGTPILMIYKLGESGKKDTLIYSNKPEHKAEFGDIEVLKTLKSGRYYLSARVEGTDNYGELLSSSILFTVTPNNLPVWAVILIVAGALGIVALVFGILHQKGVLQMLTGKVIVSMRTRANVDATLAAIRAAKVAREAEASIAAAKAREAEEQANKDKNN